MKMYLLSRAHLAYMTLYTLGSIPKILEWLINLEGTMGRSKDINLSQTCSQKEMQGEQSKDIIVPNKL